MVSPITLGLLTVSIAKTFLALFSTRLKMSAYVNPFIELATVLNATPQINRPSSDEAVKCITYNLCISVSRPLLKSKVLVAIFLAIILYYYNILIVTSWNALYRVLNYQLVKIQQHFQLELAAKPDTYNVDKKQYWYLK